MADFTATDHYVADLHDQSSGDLSAQEKTNMFEAGFPVDYPGIDLTVVSFSYILRGWNSSTRQFEYWSSMDRNSQPPSNNTLIDHTVIGTLQDGIRL